MDTIIEIRGLTRRFGDLTAVDHLDLTVARGEIFGLVGPDGAGKTTTLRMLTTLLEPDRGSCLLDGRDVREDPMDARRRLGVLPDVHGLYPRLADPLGRGQPRRVAGRIVGVAFLGMGQGQHG